MNAFRLTSGLQLCTVLLTLSAFALHAVEIQIHTPDQLREACDRAVPGDILVIQDGTYTDQHFIFNGTGTDENPITLRPETPGGVRFTGNSRLSIGGKHLVVDGFLFQGGALETGSIIEFRSDRFGPAEACTLRNTAILNYNPQQEDTRYFWVTLFGQNHVVENCWFSGQTHSGVTLCVRLGEPSAGGHLIKRNYFGNRPEGKKNGFETIRIGTGRNSDVNARCTVSENLFDRCSAETEIISNKSNENLYLGNTFLNCAGTLTLRQGNRCEVKNNVFLGGDTPGAGGIRVTGEGHTLSGNFFSGTKGRGGGAISLIAGAEEPQRGSYHQVKSCLIQGNTFVDNPGTLFALDARLGGQGSTLLPEDVLVSDNLMVAAEEAESPISAKVPPVGIQWKENVLVGAAHTLGVLEGITLVNDIPEPLRVRTRPTPLTHRDVGPGWIRQQTALDL